MQHAETTVQAAIERRTAANTAERIAKIEALLAQATTEYERAMLRARLTYWRNQQERQAQHV